MNETAHTISLISPSKSSSSFNTSNSNPNILHYKYERETRFASGMERDCSDLSRSIRHQEIFKLQPGNCWFNGLRPRTTCDTCPNGKLVTIAQNAAVQKLMRQH